MEISKDTSPKLIARITGLSYLLTLLCGIFSMGYVTNSLLIAGDAEATAINILENQPIFQLSYSVYLLEMIFQLLSIVLLYVLLKPAGPRLGVIALVFGVIGSSLKTISQLFYITPLHLLSSAKYMDVFTREQQHALAYFMLDLNTHSSAIALIFLGLFTLFAGYLIVKSTFLPKELGYITMIGGAGWLFYLHPPLGSNLFPIIALIGFIGVISIVFWLLWFGLDEEIWFAKVKTIKNQ